MKFPIMLLSILFISKVMASSDLSPIETTIQKSSNQTWVLKYRTSNPVYKLGFLRNPDNSRTSRWHPTDAHFEIVEFKGKEYLQRKDGKTFSEVSVNLTPTYKHLSKDYAPFSPFSDGDTLLYTGRLFACEEECKGNTNSWKITAEFPEGEIIIVTGKVFKQKHSWLDSDDGMNIYFGMQSPVETSNVLAVIDDGLPNKIKSSLNKDIPLMMNFFESRLGELVGAKPTLFASYANVDGHSSQGGTLPHQIFMHWNLNNLSEKVTDANFLYQTIWFFAHEVGHLYQESDGTPVFGENGESWLHEGNAEWLALKAMTALYPGTTEFVDTRIKGQRKKCSVGLKDLKLADAASIGRFDLYYSCGLVIFSAIEEALVTASDKDLYLLWNEYRKQVQQGKEKGSQTFLEILEKWTSPLFVSKVNSIINTRLENPKMALDNL